MLKRYQVILNDWMGDHYKKISQKYDVSFSEMIRMALCMDILSATRIAFPKHKIKLDEKILRDVVRKRDILDTMGIEKFHNFLSKVYFEARKATELWTDDQMDDRTQEEDKG